MFESNVVLGARGRSHQSLPFEASCLGLVFFRTLSDSINSSLTCPTYWTLSTFILIALLAGTKERPQRYNQLPPSTNSQEHGYPQVALSMRLTSKWCSCIFLSVSKFLGISLPMMAVNVLWSLWVCDFGCNINRRYALNVSSEHARSWKSKHNRASGEVFGWASAFFHQVIYSTLLNRHNTLMNADHSYFACSFWVQSKILAHELSE